MYRVALTVAFAGCMAAACSTGPSTISSGFNGSGSNSASITNLSPSAGLGYSGGKRRRPSGTRVASLNDKIPAGTYETAPRGALSDRNYGSTSLRTEHALGIINAYRKEHGLKPLKLNAKLTRAAKAHARDLSKWDRISHYGSDGSNPWDRVKRTGYKPRLTAENVGTGQVTFEEVMQGWKESKGHNKNLLLADAREAGLALVNDPKTEFKSFWTLVLGTSM
ncbi:MAG: CAP domain-containing protein [Alphaproteobacteria bacterium]|nr:CAP domain-containing protein [Alphaproteobacteria bacterium]